MVRAESSQSISFSLPFSWSLIVLWWAARIRNTPRMIINTRKLTHTTITMVAALGTTVKSGEIQISIGYSGWKKNEKRLSQVTLAGCPDFVDSTRI